MGLFFSSPKKKRVSSHDRAVLDIKVQRDKLKQYHAKITAVIERENEATCELLKQGKRKQAMLVLKKKKFQEQLLEKSEQQLANIQEMVDSIEFAQMEKRVFDGLKAGNDVLKEIHSEMSIDAVENLMADTQDALEYQEEIDKLLAGKLSEQDEADILAELDELEKDSIKLPDVPTHPVKLPAEAAKPQPEEVDGINVDDILVEEHNPKTVKAKAKDKEKEKEKGRERELVAAE